MKKLNIQNFPLNIELIPKGWVVSDLNSITDQVNSGFASGEHNQSEVGVSHLRPMNINRKGKLDLSTIKYVDPLKNSKRLKLGDILFNNTNSPPLVGKTCVININKDLAFSNHMTSIRVSDGISSNYLSYYLNFLWMSGYFLNICSKHVNQASISTDILKESIPILIAPSFEQKKIGKILETQFTIIDSIELNLSIIQKNLKRLKASVLKLHLTTSCMY